MEIKVNRIYYYSLVKNGALDELDDALLDMVLYVICKKHYDTINIKELQQDFHKLIGFEITYFPLQKILSKANKKNFLDYNNNRKIYTPNYTYIQRDSIMDNVNKSERTFSELITKFLVYLKTDLEKEITRDDAEHIINNFIEEQGVLFFENNDVYCTNPHEEYLFARFLNHLYQSEDKLLDYVNNLIIGRIFSELVLYSEDIPEEAKFENTTVYLDTGFVFRLLGIDGIDRKDIYIDLVQKMHDIGIETKMFSHSYNEMMVIISNSEQWLQNPNYDPAMSNEATDYFVRKGFQKEDLQEYVFKIKKELDFHQIEIVDIDYPQSTPTGVKTEQEYYEAIIKYYKEKSSFFDEDEKKATVEYDARSFFYINFLSQGVIPVNWFDVKNIFVTTNHSLPVVAKNVVHSENNGTKYSIPFCVSDSFLGIMLWRNSPDVINEKSYNRLLSAMYAAFMPSETLLRKLTETVKKYQEENLLSAEECYLLKTSKEAQKQLMIITQGDVDAFCEKTPLDILKEMREESIAIGREKEREKANVEIAEIQGALENEKQIQQRLESQNVDRSIELVESNRRRYELEKSHIEEKLETIKNTKKFVDKKVKRDMGLITSAFFVLIIAAIAISILVWIKSEDKDYFGLISFVAPLLYSLLFYSILASTEKEINPKTLINSFRERRRKKYWSEYQTDLKETDNLSYRLFELQKEIEKCKNEAEKLIANRK